MVGNESRKPTQKTRKGYEIPVPKRSTFDKLLGKAATKTRQKPPRG
jgi:hypothetical protein